MRTLYTVDSILFPGETNVFDSETGQLVGYATKGILGDTLLFDNKGNNIGFAVDNILGDGKTIFVKENDYDF